MTASRRTKPHILAKSRICEARCSCSSEALIGGFGKWGGWGSNPRPADYEKYCDTRSHVVSERVEEVWLMPGT